jgi:hypothetical protein
MLISTVISGPTNGVRGAGLGQAADLVQGITFKCAKTSTFPEGICYGVKQPGEPDLPKGGAAHALLIQLKHEINNFSTKAGFTKLKEDGFIGGGSVFAAQKVAKFIRTNIPALATNVALQIAASPGLTKEILTAKAPALIEAFISAAAGGPVAQQPPAQQPAQQPPAQRQPPAQQPPAQQPAQQPPAQLPGEPVEPAPSAGMPPEFAAGMAAIINACKSAPNSPLCVNARAACTRPLTVTESDAPAVQGLCTALNAIPVAGPTTTTGTGISTKTWLIIGGAAAGVVLISVIGIVAFRGGRKREAVAVSGPSRFRRRLAA